MRSLPPDYLLHTFWCNLGQEATDAAEAWFRERGIDKIVGGVNNSRSFLSHSEIQAVIPLLREAIASGKPVVSLTQTLPPCPYCYQNLMKLAVNSKKIIVVLFDDPVAAIADKAPGRVCATVYDPSVKLLKGRKLPDAQLLTAQDYLDLIKPK